MMAATSRTAPTLLRGLPGVPSTSPSTFHLVPVAASLTHLFFPLYPFQAPRERLFHDGCGPAHRPHDAPWLAWCTIYITEYVFSDHSHATSCCNFYYFFLDVCLFVCLFVIYLLR